MLQSDRIYNDMIRASALGSWTHRRSVCVCVSMKGGRGGSMKGITFFFSAARRDQGSKNPSFFVPRDPQEISVVLSQGKVCRSSAWFKRWIPLAPQEVCTSCALRKVDSPAEEAKKRYPFSRNWSKGGGRRGVCIMYIIIGVLIVCMVSILVDNRVMRGGGGGGYLKIGDL